MRSHGRVCGSIRWLGTVVTAPAIRRADRPDNPHPAIAIQRSKHMKSMVCFTRSSWHTGLSSCAALAFGLTTAGGGALAQSQNAGHVAQHKNMRLVGLNDLQGRSAYQPIVHEQGGRSIAYIGHHGGEAANPLNNNVVVKNGTSIVDVTDPRRQRYLFQFT